MVVQKDMPANVLTHRHMYSSNKKAQHPKQLNIEKPHNFMEFQRNGLFIKKENDELIKDVIGDNHWLQLYG